MVKLDKGEFVGTAALASIKREGVARKLVGFEMTGRGIARHGYPIVDARGPARSAACTSGAPGLTLGKNIGLGYVPTRMAALGHRASVEIRGKASKPSWCKTPFYKRGDRVNA